MSALAKAMYERYVRELCDDDEYRKEYRMYLDNVEKVDGVLLHSPRVHMSVRYDDKKRERVFNMTLHWGVRKLPGLVVYGLLSMDENYRKEDKLTLGRFEQFVEELKAYLSRVKFDNIEMRFYDPSETQAKELEMFREDYGTCCVCSDGTTFQTKCAHALCVRCYQRLRKNVCPMCRRDTCFCDECGGTIVSRKQTSCFECDGGGCLHCSCT